MELLMKTGTLYEIFQLRESESPQMSEENNEVLKDGMKKNLQEDQSTSSKVYEKYGGGLEAKKDENFGMRCSKS